jgi:predicted metalloprotease
LNPWNTGDVPQGPLPPPLPSPYAPRVQPPPSPYYGPPQPQQYNPYPMPPARPVMPPPMHAQTAWPPVPMSPYPPPPPPRRPSRRPFVTLFLIGLVVLGVAVIGLNGRSRSQQSSPPPPTGLPTSVPSTSPGTGGNPDGVDKLGDNPLFSASGGPKQVTCQLPRWQSVPAASNAYFTAALPCLDAAWSPVLQSVSLPFHEPKLAFPSGKTWSSPCGSVSQEEAAAFYCGGDQTLYMPMSGLQTDVFGNHSGAYLAVFAHEYGHFVQDLSGVLTAAHEKEYTGADPDNAASLEVSRRLELQAQCFSGLFLAAAVGRGSVDQAVARDAQDTQERGDQPGERRDHGTSVHASAWWTQGFVKQTVAQCNTWVASSSDVQ